MSLCFTSANRRRRTCAGDSPLAWSLAQCRATNQKEQSVNQCCGRSRGTVGRRLPASNIRTASVRWCSATHARDCCDNHAGGHRAGHRNKASCNLWFSSEETNYSRSARNRRITPAIGGWDPSTVGWTAADSSVACRCAEDENTAPFNDKHPCRKWRDQPNAYPRP